MRNNKTEDRQGTRSNEYGACTLRTSSECSQPGYLSSTQKQSSAVIRLHDNSSRLTNKIKIFLLHHHLFLNRKGRCGTTDNFATSFLHFSLFSTALWDLLNSRPVHSLMLSSHLFLCLPCLLPPFTVPCKMVLARPDERET